MTRQLSADDLYPLPRTDTARTARREFDALFRRIPRGAKHRLGRAILVFVRPQLARGGVFKFTYDTLLFVGPTALKCGPGRKRAPAVHSDAR